MSKNEKGLDGESAYPLLDQYKGLMDSNNKLNLSEGLDPIGVSNDTNTLRSKDASNNHEIAEEKFGPAKLTRRDTMKDLHAGESVKISFTNLNYTVTINATRE